MLHSINVVECVLTFCGDVCVSFSYAVCRCYKRSVRVGSVLYRGLVCVPLSGI
jgi:hypothetical protein